MNNAKAEQPPFLPPGYELLSQLKGNENDVSVCVVRDRESFGKMLFKRAETADGTEQLKNEMRMLSLIHAQDNSSPYARLFPSVRDSGEEGGCWFVREWIKGHTLAELAESGRDEPGLPRMQALGCLISVTEQLSFLHGLRPPVIHRDIKPQNIVIDPSGQCRLIDFGIARHFCPGQKTDTMIAGTQAASPPEQFGYSQTDERSDLYS